GLQRATNDLAEKIVETRYPTLAAAALLRDGRAERALLALERARSLQTKDPATRLNLCLGLEANSRFTEAADCYLQARNSDPSSRRILVALARAYYLEGQNKEGENTREEAVRRFRQLAQQGYKPALLDLGKALCDMGDHDGALKAYWEFLDSEPKSG